MAVGLHLHDDQQERTTKSWWLSGAVSVFFLVLFLRLAFVQILQAENNIRLSKENRMQLHVLDAPRGQIYDRNGVVLARNRPSYSICVLPYKLRDREKVVTRLCRIRDERGEQVFDSTALVKQLKRARFRRFDLTRLMEDVSIELVSVIEEHSMELPGIVVETEARREYPMGAATFHVLGYMSEIPESKFDSLKTVGYRYGDLMGKAGIEKEYEEVLRGDDGREYVEVNAYGKRLGVVPNMPRADPVPGYGIYLTLDARLQKVAQEAFPDSLKGAVVALDPSNGEVLVMFSSPAVDPNIFSLSSLVRSKRWAAIATDPSLPLNNRATTGTYTPGSTFKLVSATAGMHRGELDGSSRMSRPCTGAYRFGNRVAHCWYGKGHGRLDLIGAVQKSCNVYFYQLGLMLGDEAINEVARMVGLGEKTGIDLPRERSGYLSGEKAHNKRFARKIKESEGWKWTRGLLLDLAIGQQQILTPLQLARMVGTLANGKTLYRPFLAKEMRTREGLVVEQTNPHIERTLSFDKETLETIRTAMHKVVGPGGTARRAMVPDVAVGGKTGSAENPHGDKTHSLFVGVAPVDNPQIAVAVVAENAGHGSSVAAPVAGEVLRYFFKHISPPQPHTVAQTTSETSN